jgi:hypothetical protein
MLHYRLSLSLDRNDPADEQHQTRAGGWKESSFGIERVNIYVLGFVAAATAGAVAYVVSIRTGSIGCLLVALAPLAFVLAFVPIAGPLLVPPEPASAIHAVSVAAVTSGFGLGRCSGMSPGVVRLDLAGADDFSVAWQSLPRTDPQSA